MVIYIYVILFFAILQGFLHMLPETHEGWETYTKNHNIDVNLPLGIIVICAGNKFFKIVRHLNRVSIIKQISFTSRLLLGIFRRRSRSFGSRSARSQSSWCESTQGCFDPLVSRQSWWHFCSLRFSRPRNIGRRSLLSKQHQQHLPKRLSQQRVLPWRRSWKWCRVVQVSSTWQFSIDSRYPDYCSDY